MRPAALLANHRTAETASLKGGDAAAEDSWPKTKNFSIVLYYFLYITLDSPILFKPRSANICFYSFVIQLNNLAKVL